MRSEVLFLLGAGLDGHLLDGGVLVHLDELLLVLAIKVVPHVDESLFDDIEFAGSLAIEGLTLGGMLLLDTGDLTLMAADQHLGVSQ